MTTKTTKCLREPASATTARASATWPARSPPGRRSPGVIRNGEARRRSSSMSSCRSTKLLGSPPATKLSASNSPNSTRRQRKGAGHWPQQAARATVAACPARTPADMTTAACHVLLSLKHSPTAEGSPAVNRRATDRRSKRKTARARDSHPEPERRPRACSTWTRRTALRLPRESGTLGKVAGREDRVHQPEREPDDLTRSQPDGERGSGRIQEQQGETEQPEPIGSSGVQSPLGMVELVVERGAIVAAGT